MPEPLSAERLAGIRADIALATDGPPRRERFEAWTRAADSHAETLLAEVDRLTAKVQPYEAAIAAVAVQAAEWAALSSGHRVTAANAMPSDSAELLANAGRLIQRLMAQPAADAEAQR